MDKILCPVKNQLQLTASAPNMLFESFFSYEHRLQPECLSR